MSYLYWMLMIYTVCIVLSNFLCLLFSELFMSLILLRQTWRSPHFYMIVTLYFVTDTSNDIKNPRDLYMSTHKSKYHWTHKSEDVSLTHSKRGGERFMMRFDRTDVIQRISHLNSHMNEEPSTFTMCSVTKSTATSNSVTNQHV